MTINRTRELLGEEVKNLSDEEISKLIAQASRFCDVILDLVNRKILTQKNIGVKNGN